MDSLLKIEDLRIEFSTDTKPVLAVDGVDLTVKKGKTLGLVGESGCGKSVTSLAVMKLLPANASLNGKICFNGENLLDKSEKQMEAIRGNRISMIFQEPMTSLNPVFTIENQLSEVISLHQGGNKKQIKEKTIEILDLVGISNPGRRMKDYPHHLSGGMRQRVVIAMALACNPDLLIADEPTTALDVTIQAQILALMKKLQEKLGTGILMITHDLGVVAQVADDIAVMYAGQLVEYATADELFANPRHPYTRGLLNTIPTLHKKQERLQEITGMVPDLSLLPEGCRFYPRCNECMDVCTNTNPPLVKNNTARIRCWKYGKS